MTEKSPPLDAPSLLPLAQKCGWLEKLSSKAGRGRHRARMAAVFEGKFGQRKWKRRFFLIHDRALYYYLSDTAATPRAVISLTDYHSATQDLDKFIDRHCIRIISMGKVPTIYLSCTNKEEMNDWITIIRNALPNAEDQDKMAMEWLEKKVEQEQSMLESSQDNDKNILAPSESTSRKDSTKSASLRSRFTSLKQTLSKRISRSGSQVTSSSTVNDSDSDTSVEEDTELSSAVQNSPKPTPSLMITRSRSQSRAAEEVAMRTPKLLVADTESETTSVQRAGSTRSRRSRRSSEPPLDRDDVKLASHWYSDSFVLAGLALLVVVGAATIQYLTTSTLKIPFWSSL